MVSGVVLKYNLRYWWTRMNKYWMTVIFSSVGYAGSVFMPRYIRKRHKEHLPLDGWPMLYHLAIDSCSIAGIIKTSIVPWENCLIAFTLPSIEECLFHQTTGSRSVSLPLHNGWCFEGLGLITTPAACFCNGKINNYDKFASGWYVFLAVVSMAVTQNIMKKL